MFHKPLHDIVPADMNALLSEKVAEGRSLEYKRGWPGNSNADKKELLADVSAFANTGGGDLILGIDESSGVPTAIVGIDLADPDAQMQRIENILTSGLSPRVRYSMRRVACSPGVEVLILRVDPSWNAPHRVIFDGYDKFYARNTNGKYQMDVIELRDAFWRTSSVCSKIQEFHEHRIGEIALERTPVPAGTGPKLVLHLLPMSAFASAEQFDVLPLHSSPQKLPPMSARSWNHRITVEGVLTYSPPEIGTPSYAHVYRTGIVEAVDGYILNLQRDGKRYIPSVTYERRLIDSVGTYLTLLNDLGVRPPIYVQVALVGATGCWMGAVDSFYDLSDRYPIDRDRLMLPSATVNDFAVPIAPLLKPVLDVAWNACGYQKSLNFDGQGNWAPKSG